MSDNVHLTQSFISKIVPPETGYDIYWDDEVPGFGLRVMHTGTASYIINYRNGGGKQRRKTIGRAKVTVPAVARKNARRRLDALAAGKDPLEKAEVKLTFAELAEMYITRHAAEMKTGDAEERAIRKDILPALGKIPAGEVRRRDIRELAYKIKDRGSPVMANRVISVTSRIYSFALEEDMLEASPAVAIKPVAVEKARDRFLPESELPIWWAESEAQSWNCRAALRMILVTGQRPGEMASMEWSEIDGDWWTIPAEKSKNGHAHHVPLSPLALSILDSLPRGGEYVFPSRRGKGIDTTRHISVNAISHAVAKLRKDSTLDHWTAHDLRRTCATHLGRLGFGTHVWTVLNHTPRGVTKKVYNLYDYDREKRLALNTWGDEITRLISGESAKVVPMVK